MFSLCTLEIEKDLEAQFGAVEALLLPIEPRRLRLTTVSTSCLSRDVASVCLAG